MPLVLGGGDVLAAAETGSGKTGAFGLPAPQSCTSSCAATPSERRLRPRRPPGRSRRSRSVLRSPRPRMSEADRPPPLAARHDASLGVSVVQARSERQWAGARASVGVPMARSASRHASPTKAPSASAGAPPRASRGSARTRSGSGSGARGKNPTRGSSRRTANRSERATSSGASSTARRPRRGVAAEAKAEAEAEAKARGRFGSQKTASTSGSRSRFPRGWRIARCSRPSRRRTPSARCASTRRSRTTRRTRRIERSGGSNDESSNGLRTVFEGSRRGAGRRRDGGAEAEAEEWTEAETASSRDGRDRRSRDAASRPRTPRALVLEPARDLAEQTSRFFAQFSRYLVSPKPRVALFVGGDDRASQRSMLSGPGSVGVDVAVGTPGRVLDLVEAGDMDLGRCGVFILDEADRLLDAGGGGHREDPRDPREGAPDADVLGDAALAGGASAADATCRADAHWIDLKGKDAGAARDGAPRRGRGRREVRPSGATRRHAGLLATLATDRAHEHDGVADAEASRPDALEDVDGTKNDTIDARARALASLATKRFKPPRSYTLDAFAPEQCLVFCRQPRLRPPRGAPSLGRGRFRRARFRRRRCESGPQSEYCARARAPRSTAERARTSARSRRARRGFSCARTSPRAAWTSRACRS